MLAKYLVPRVNNSDKPIVMDTSDCISRLSDWIQQHYMYPCTFYFILFWKTTRHV